MTAQLLQHLDVPSVTSVVAAITSIAAIAIALYGAIKRNARIYVMNSAEREQRSQQVIALTYDDLPQTVRERFPRYHDANPVCALCSIVFANSGDRSGYVRLTDIAVEPETVAASRYNYVTIPPNSIVGHSVLLHNISGVAFDQPCDLTLHVTYQSGGIRRDRRRAARKSFTAAIKVSASGSYQ